MTLLSGVESTRLSPESTGVTHSFWATRRRNKLRYPAGILPRHELLELGAGQVETGPVSVSHRFVFRGSQVGQQGGHLVKRSPADRLVVPGISIKIN